uniref:MaoC-like domain-containing protein n=1 Tax=Schlesneria paludicola TaxID=360056 RepID=A0A7C2NVY4_9PLAN
MHREYFEDTQVGDRIVTPGRTVTETDVVNFAGFTGDWNPIHVDEEFARRLPAGRRIAHGLLALVVGVNLIGRARWTSFWPRSVQTIAGIDRVRFVAPVFIGDTLHTEGGGPRNAGHVAGSRTDYIQPQ